jgi:hypothetical protein
MTNLDVYKIIHEWANGILSPLGVSVVLAFQNAPMRANPQVAISKATVKQIGRSTRTIAGTVATLSSDYEGTFQMWETGGEGNYLRALINRLDSSATKSYFRGKNVAVDCLQDVLYVPRLDDKNYIEESTAVFTVRFVDSVTENITGIQENVYVGTVSDATNGDIETTFTFNTEQGE